MWPSSQPRGACAHPLGRSRRVRAAAPGVAFALSGADLLKLLPPVPDAQLSLPSKWRTAVQHKILNPQQPLLAHDKVRHVGEAVAVIVADSRYAAEDAAELVAARSRSLAGGGRCRGGAAAGGRVIHEQSRAPISSASSRSARAMSRRRSPARRTRLKRRFYHHRYAAVADGMPRRRRRNSTARTESVTIWSSTQVVHWVRREAATRLAPARGARALHRARRRRRLRRQGPRLSRGSADSFPRPHDRAAGAVDRGSARASSVLLPFARSDARGRGGLRRRWPHPPPSSDHFMVDCGAWNPIGAGIAYNTAVHLPGPYKIDNFAVDGAGRLHQQGAERALSRRRAAGSRLRHRAHHGPRRARMRARSRRRCAGATWCPPPRCRIALGLPYRDGVPISL